MVHHKLLAKYLEPSHAERLRMNKVLLIYNNFRTYFKFITLLLDVKVAISNATLYELSLCTAKAKDCNIEVTESKEVLIPGCGATTYPNKADWKRVLTVEQGKIIEFNLIESSFVSQRSKLYFVFEQ